MTEYFEAPAITRARVRRSRVLGVLIGLVIASGLVYLEWATIDGWSDINPVLVMAGQSVVAVSLLVPLRTRWLGFGMCFGFGMVWIVMIGLFLLALFALARYF